MFYVDDSIFEGVKKDIYNIIFKCKKESLINIDPRLDAILYICDDKIIEEVKEQEERLNMEYGYDEELAKRYGIHNIIKYVNEERPADYYKLYIKELWRQINDQEKVRERLDAEYEVWKNALRKRTLEKLKKEKKDEKVVELIEKKLELQFKEAKEKLDFIKRNFDKLDVRISDYEIRKPYTAVTISFLDRRGKRRVRNITLRKSVPNLLWYKPKTDYDELTKLQKYLKKAKKAFGSVYYAEVDDE